MSNSVGSKFRHALEALTSTFLFLFLYIPVVGPWYGFMFFPLANYICVLFWTLPEFRGMQFWLLFLDPKLMFGRAVAIVGFTIFLIAFTQLLKVRGRLVRGGLYSAVRHPQYLGLIVMTFGISMMCVEWAGFHAEFLYIWMILVLGYVLLAGYEERHLLIEYSKDYQKYQQKVSFIFPTPRISKISEHVISLMIALIMGFLLTLTL